jgi:hypothetical protein
VIQSPVPIVVLAGQSNGNEHALAACVFGQVAQSGGLLVLLAAYGALDPGADGNGTGDGSASGAAGAGELFQALWAQLSARLDPNAPDHVPSSCLAGTIWVRGEADSWHTAAVNWCSDLQPFERLDRPVRRACAGAFRVLGPCRRSSGFRPAQAANWQRIQGAQSTLAAAQQTATLINPDRLAADYGFADLLGRSLAQVVLRDLPLADLTEALWLL